jgi:hypothetical protein
MVQATIWLINPATETSCHEIMCVAPGYLAPHRSPAGGVAAGGGRQRRDSAAAGASPAASALPIDLSLVQKANGCLLASTLLCIWGAAEDVPGLLPPHKLPVLLTASLCLPPTLDNVISPPTARRRAAAGGSRCGRMHVI